MSMNDLFQMDPQITIHDFTSIKLTGNYRIIRFEEKYCSFLLDGFHIEIEGTALQLDILQEHLTYLKIKGLISINITKGGGN